jgi:histidinol-phosphate aminotransferase
MAEYPMDAFLPRFTPSAQMRDPRGMLRLGLSESSAGCCQEATEALHAELAAVSRYPDAAASSLTSALARHTDLPAEAITVGNGIDELLLFSALALITGGGAGFVSESTYAGHGAAVSAAHAPRVTLPLKTDSTVDTDALAAALSMPGSVGFLCNPHNPTGSAVPADALEKLVYAAEQHGSVLVVDEAYMEYAEPDLAVSAVPYVRQGAPVVVLRTFSKIYGLAGLRCGYALAPAACTDRLRSIKNVAVYNVNRYALAAAEAAVRNQWFITRVRAANRRTMAGFLDAMSRHAWFSARRSVTNFLLCELPWDAETVADELANRGVLVRPCADLGYPRGLRISLGTPQEMDLAGKALIDVAAALARRGKR